jgi:hypothetical protein
MDRVIGTFRYSIPKIVGLVAAGILLTAASLMIVTHVIPDAGTKGLIAGYVGVPLFGVATIWLLTRFFKTGPVVEVSTAGIRYYRRSADLIPWSAIAAMSVHVMRRQKFLVLELFPEAAARLKASRSARILEKGNEAFGFSGVWISMSGLDGSLDDLIDAIELAGGGALGGRHD